MYIRVRDSSISCGVHVIGLRCTFRAFRAIAIRLFQPRASRAPIPESIAGRTLALRRFIAGSNGMLLVVLVIIAYLAVLARVDTI